MFQETCHIKGRASETGTVTDCECDEAIKIQGNEIHLLKFGMNILCNYILFVTHNSLHFGYCTGKDTLLQYTTLTINPFTNMKIKIVWVVALYQFVSSTDVLRNLLLPSSGRSERKIDHQDGRRRFL